MKKLMFVLAAVLLFAGNAGAVVKETSSSLPSFTMIKISSCFDVTFVESEDCGITISADEAVLDYIVADVKGLQLVLDIETTNMPAEVKKLFRRKDAAPEMKVVIKAPSANLSQVTLERKAKLSSCEFQVGNFVFSCTDNAVVQDVSIVSRYAVNVSFAKRSSGQIKVFTNKLGLDITSSGAVTLEQDVDESSISVNSGCSFTLSGDAGKLSYNGKQGAKSKFTGNVDEVTFNCAGTSQTDATELVCKNADVTMNGLCTLKVAPTEKLEINIGGGATLEYSGKPEIDIVSIKTSSVKKN